MQRDQDYGLQTPGGPEAHSTPPARSPDDHLNAAHKINQAHRARPPATVLWKYSGAGEHVIAGTPDAEPRVPPACHKYYWRVIAKAAPGNEFRPSGDTYVERRIRP